MLTSRALVIGLISFLTLIDLFGSQALLPLLVADFGVDRASMGFAVNASTIGMVIAGLAVAFFSRHINRQKGIWLSLLLLSIPTFLLGVVDDLSLFTLLRITQGLFMSAAFTLTMAYLAEECSSAEIGQAMAAYITGNVASNLLGRLLAASFADWVGLSGSFWMFAGLNLAGAAIAARCLGRTTAREAVGPQQSPFAVWRDHVSNPVLRAAFVIGFLILFAFLGVFTYVNFVLSAPPFVVAPAALGIVYLVFIPSVLTTPMASRMVARHGVLKTYLISIAVACAGLIALLTSNLVIVLIGLALVGVGTFCAQAATTGFIGQAAKTERAAASGLYLASYYLGGLVGALVIGQVFENVGWASAIAVVGAALLLSCLFALRMRERN